MKLPTFSFLKGYRTLIVNVCGILFSVAAMYGFDVPDDMQNQISMGVLAALNIWLRFHTDTPVGQKTPS